MRLGFYINSALRLRETQGAGEPDPAIIAATGELAGAEVILVGWNPAGGLIKARDVRLIREVVGCDLVMFVPGALKYIETVVRVRPNGVVLVPTEWDGIKPPGAVDLNLEGKEIAEATAGYKAAGIPVSTLTEPDISSLKAVARTNVDGIVLDCSRYTFARSDEEAEAALNQLDNAALAVHKFGFVSSFSGGLHYRNVTPIASLAYGEEIYIGRAIINRAIIKGLDQSINDMTTIIHRCYKNSH